MLINATPHAINIIAPSGSQLTVPPSGTVARAEQESAVIGSLCLDGHPIPVITVRYGVLSGLPAEEAGRCYIVSALAAQAAKAAGRTDCLIVSDTVRSDDGRIIGCRALARL